VAAVSRCEVFFWGIMLQALVDSRRITSAAVGIGVKLVPYTVMRPLTTGIRTGETRR
jgi:hypothetical protein